MAMNKYFISCFDHYTLGSVGRNEAVSDGWKFSNFFGIYSDCIGSNAAVNWHSRAITVLDYHGTTTAIAPNCGSTVEMRVQGLMYANSSGSALGIADASGNEQIHVLMNATDNSVALYRGSTVIGTGIVPTIIDGSLHWVELYALASLTSGKTEVRIDGEVVTALTLNKQNTCNTGTAVYARAYFCYTTCLEVAVQYDASILTPFNKARVYSGSFGTLNSNSGTVVGSQDALGILNTAARSGSNYIEWAGIGSIDATVAPLSDFGDIVAVQMNPCMMASNSGVVTAAVSMSDGTHTIAGDTVYPAASYTGTFPLSSDTAPDGGAWTDAKVAALHGIIARTA